MNKYEKKYIDEALNGDTPIRSLEVIQKNYNCKVKQLLTTCNFYEFHDEEDTIIYELHINDEVIEFRDLLEVTKIFNDLLNIYINIYK